MGKRRSASVLAALVVAMSTGTSALAQSGPPDDVPRGREQEDRSRAADAPGRIGEPAPAPQLPAQPRNDELEVVPADPDDASLRYGLTPYHDIAPRLQAIQDSDRISVEVIGESVSGRDLHLVVATSPMSDAEWDDWQRLSDLRTADPEAAIAALEAGAYDGWRTPVFVNNNIHGNEWEGTDATLQVLEELATSDDEGILGLLDQHVMAFVVTMNPDGRVAGTRANANGFDMNRDFFTQLQPEVRAVRDQLFRYDPVTMLDIHGYVRCTLIEPTTGPHGDNYEYDLYIRQAIRNALAMEEAIVALGETRTGTTCENPDGSRRVTIPWRDWLSGWDDWPPIFTPMYAMYHGAVGHTVEVPINPRGIGDEASRHDASRINTAVARAAIEGNLAYAAEHADALLADQLEIFRRGAAGEATRPVDDELALSLANAGTVGGYEVDNAETFVQDFPRAYVIPAGADQRSDTAAARTVQFLIDNDVEVLRAWRPIQIAGQRYEAGSYVVDLEQAKRGLANTALDVGRDVTDDFPTMYDISAWSQGYLWGVDVDVVEDGELPVADLRSVAAAAPTGSIAPGRRDQYGLDVDSLAGIQAVQDLVAREIHLSRTEDGTFVVPGDRSLASSIADEHGVDLVAVTAAEARTATPFSEVSVATSAPFDEVYALNRMGFTTTSVSDEAFNEGTSTFDEFDAIFVSTTAFDPRDLDPTQQAAFAQWLADGGVVVGRGGGGIAFNDRASLLEVTSVAGRRDANGIVAVVNDAASRVTGAALPHSFVTSPRHFTDLGEGVRVDQRLADDGFFLAGHWRDRGAFTGQPVVVSGTARGADVTLFGTEPLYRAHPEGLHQQVAEALWQAAD